MTPQNATDITAAAQRIFDKAKTLPGRKIVFTNALVGGWRPAENYYPNALTAIITLSDHKDGTAYAAHVMHKNAHDRDQHNDMGFLEGWGTCATQLAQLVE